MSNFKVGDLVRYRKRDFRAPVCEEGTVLRIIDISDSGQSCICEIVFGAGLEAHNYWRVGNRDRTMVFTDELEALHE